MSKSSFQGRYGRAKANRKAAWLKRNQKQHEAIARQLAYVGLSADEKLDRLIPGGSSRQRARLAAGKEL